MMRIGQFSNYVGIDATTLRAWHEQGLLVPLITKKGHRRYTQDLADRAMELKTLNLKRKLRTEE